jgi:ectoine hydroxylase-related dioxygenase (phytanoyl-CoA dioxygenase family)
MTSDELDKHAFAVDVSGYTVIPAQVSESELVELRDASQRALAAVWAHRQAGGKLKHVAIGTYNRAALCLYAWSDTCVRLLEHETIHNLSARLFGNYRLWEQSVLTAEPREDKSVECGWHRDFGDSINFHTLKSVPSYLRFFICLSDITLANGATWVVPGTHRVFSPFEPPRDQAWPSGDLDSYPSRVPVLAKAGDIIVFNPAMIHSPGANHTTASRQLLCVVVCHDSLDPLVNHWAIAGPRIRGNASERLRHFLGADLAPLDTSWDVLPPGWQTTDEPTV